MFDSPITSWWCICCLQCRTTCTEDMAFTDTCRIPGYRNYSISSEFAQVQVCKTEADYVKCPALGRSTSYPEKSRALTRATEACTKTCAARPCTQIAYKATRMLSAVDIYDRELTNFTNIWMDTVSKRTSLRLTMATSKIRVFTQTYAYGIWQLVGEVGGTWGLFLGLSAITVLNSLEKIGARCLKSFRAARANLRNALGVSA